MIEKIKDTFISTNFDISVMVVKIINKINEIVGYLNDKESRNDPPSKNPVIAKKDYDFTDCSIDRTLRNINYCMTIEYILDKIKNKKVISNELIDKYNELLNKL